MSEIMRNELGTSYPLRGFKYLILRLFVGESLQDLMKKLLLKIVFNNVLFFNIAF